MLSVGAVVALLLSSATCVSAKDICHGLECPKYTVLNHTKDWELRRYDVTKWVATNTTAMTEDKEVEDAMFFKLFHYISGQNAKSQKIPMTAPVLTKVIHGAGPNCASTFVMHFMLTFDQWAEPIPPTDSSVYIVETPQMDVYVRGFGGFATEQDYVTNLNKLATELTTSGASVEDKFFFDAGYDGPYTFLGRHNEVWLLKK